MEGEVIEKVPASMTSFTAKFWEVEKTMKKGKYDGLGIKCNTESMMKEMET